jgi:thymidylate synthase
MYDPRKQEELEYVALLCSIIANGEVRQDRTRVGTRSVFGINKRYSLLNNKEDVLARCCRRAVVVH